MVSYKIYANIRISIDKIYRFEFANLNEIYLNFSTRNIIGLDLSHQKWDRLPDELKLFNKLQYINITDNKRIKSFPKILYNLRNLHTIIAEKNDFIFDENDILYITNIPKFVYTPLKK